jgi:hypothetical protein
MKSFAASAQNTGPGAAHVEGAVARALKAHSQYAHTRTKRKRSSKSDENPQEHQHGGP